MHRRPWGRPSNERITTLCGEQLCVADGLSPDLEHLAEPTLERVKHIRVQLRAARLGQDANGLLDRHSPAIDAVRGERVEAVAARDDPPRQWDLVAAQPVRVTLTVDALV